MVQVHPLNHSRNKDVPLIMRTEILIKSKNNVSFGIQYEREAKNGEPFTKIMLQQIMRWIWTFLDRQESLFRLEVGLFS